MNEQRMQNQITALAPYTLERVCGMVGGEMVRVHRTRFDLPHELCVVCLDIAFTGHGLIIRNLLPPDTLPYTNHIRSKFTKRLINKESGLPFAVRALLFEALNNTYKFIYK